MNKLATGIVGFDAMLAGGLPVNRVTLFTGQSGAGKTVLALQLLSNLATCGDNALFVAFEEHSADLVANAASFSWELESHAGERIHFIDADLGDADLISGDFEIAGLIARIEAQAAAVDAKVVVLDGLDLLLSLLPSKARARQEIYRLRRWMRQSGQTVILTAKLGESDMGSDLELGYVVYAADCVVALGATVDNSIVSRTLRVVKYRGSTYYGAETPLVISQDGISVAHASLDRLEHPVFEDRVATGIERLDFLLGGGYLRGSSTLISGAPGTAKTTLAAAFTEVSAQAGMKTLFVSFDESDRQIQRNVKSVDIHLEPHLEAGNIRMLSLRAAGTNAEEHYLKLQQVMDEFEPACMVVDPISALQKAGGFNLAFGVTERLLDQAKQRGMTSIFTSLLESAFELEQSSSHISTIADTWIMLGYVSHGGERNRSLSIIKSRGTAHSNQVRELVLHDEGITLSDVYTAGGEVLMGTARQEYEAEQAAVRRRAAESHDRAQQELHSRIEHGQQEMQRLEKDLEQARAELAALERTQADEKADWDARAARTRKSRRGEADDER